MTDYGYTHHTASTSRKHFKTFDAGSLHDLIMKKLREDTTRDFCISELASELGLERSTTSARMNELRNYGLLEHTGQKRSKITQVLFHYWRAKTQDSLF